MDFTQLKTNAKAKLNGKFGDLLLASSLTIVIQLVANVLPGVGMLLVSGPITYGLAKIYIDASNGKDVDWRDLFRFFKNCWGKTLYLQTSSILHAWPALVCLVGAIFLGSVVSGVGVAIANHGSYSALGVSLAISAIINVLGFFAFIGILIIRGVETSMSNFILNKEPELDGKQAVEKSVKYMRGHVWEFIWLNITMILYYLANVFFNYGDPMISMTKTDYYTSLYENTPVSSSATSTPQYTGSSATASTRTCPSCGSPIGGNARFCAKCGATIDQ